MPCRLVTVSFYQPTPEAYLHVSMYRLSIYNIIFFTVLNVDIVLHAYK